MSIHLRTSILCAMALLLGLAADARADIASDYAAIRGSLTPVGGPPGAAVGGVLPIGRTSFNCDVSPRGDPPGFVRILDDQTLLMPERPGNRIADSLRNILSNPHVGLLFVVPGVTETFRVNGRATLTTDAELLAPSVVEGKLPKLGILIDIDVAYTQCSKAFLRSHLWDASKFLERSALPSNGEIHRAIQGDHFDAEKYDAERAARYARREGFY